MVTLLLACGWILSGPDGLVWTLIAGVLSLALSPRVSPRLVLRLYRARPLYPRRSAGRPCRPGTHLRARGASAIVGAVLRPQPDANAFAVGHSPEAAIALTDGLLRHLTLRELAGVLAHEVSHVRNHDLWIVGLADAIGRLTSLMSFFGMILLAIDLPICCRRDRLSALGLDPAAHIRSHHRQSFAAGALAHAGVRRGP
jgi:heat shock protein HtpX